MLQSTLFLTFILSWQKITHVMCLSKQFIKLFNAIQYLILDYKDNYVYIYGKKEKAKGIFCLHKTHVPCIWLWQKINDPVKFVKIKYMFTVVPLQWNVFYVV